MVFLNFKAAVTTSFVRALKLACLLFATIGSCTSGTSSGYSASMLHPLPLAYAKKTKQKHEMMSGGTLLCASKQVIFALLSCCSWCCGEVSCPVVCYSISCSGQGKNKIHRDGEISAGIGGRCHVCERVDASMAPKDTHRTTSGVGVVLYGTSRCEQQGMMHHGTLSCGYVPDLL